MTRSLDARGQVVDARVVGAVPPGRYEQQALADVLREAERLVPPALCEQARHRHAQVQAARAAGVPLRLVMP